MPTSLAAAPATTPVELEHSTGSADGDGGLNAQRDAPVGGQAVLEGVMMRGVAHWAVAVRKPTAEQLEEEQAREQDGEPIAAEGEIEVSTFPLTSSLQRHRALRLPIVRGVVALGESMAIGFRALGISANAQLPPAEGATETTPADGAAEAAESRNGDGRGDRVMNGVVNGDGGPIEGGGSEAEEEQEQGQEISGGVWAGTIAVALVFAIGLFFVIPVALTSLIKGQLHSSVLFWVVEGIVRTAIFFGYMLLLSRLRDLRRVFEYHGAEHKTISCYEAGLPLTPVNAQRFTRLHPRCGTSFLLVVMIVAIFVFAPIGLPAWYWLVATRILGVPLIAGISFELIKFAGRNRRRRWVQIVMWPGLKLQLLTTREPDLDQLAVAIAALEAVLALESPGDLSAADLMGVEVVA
jgi:uncharacterized protein YqhQ